MADIRGTMNLTSPDSAEFLEKLPQRWARSVLWVFCVILVLLSAWAAWCRLDVSVSGRGLLVSGVPPVWVQSPACGPVQDVWIRPGETVAAGARLLVAGGQTLTAPQGALVTVVRVAPGAQVEAGEVLVGLTPSDAPFEFEALIANRDVGYLQVGQAAWVHLDAYPLERYGSLPATVEAIQPGLETGDHAFRVRLKLGRQSVVGNGQDVHALVPALTGEVELVVGEQSLLDLILRPAL